MSLALPGEWARGFAVETTSSARRLLKSLLSWLFSWEIYLILLAGAAALTGLWLYEDSWVRAGQSVPLS